MKVLKIAFSYWSLWWYFGENSLKEFSIILNIKDFEAEILEINFRAYSIGSTDPNGTINYEIVPK